MILRIDHVSIAVKDYDKAEKFFIDLLELIPGASGRDERSGFMWQIFSAGDLSRFEIIAPLKQNSFLNRFLSDKEGGVHHITFQVQDIKRTADYLKIKGIPFFGYNDKYPDWKELFIHPRDAFGLLIQFAEFNASDWLSAEQNICSGKKWLIAVKNNKAVIEIQHPGGGKVENELTASEIDMLIAELTAAKNKIG